MLSHFNPFSWINNNNNPYQFCNNIIDDTVYFEVTANTGTNGAWVGLGVNLPNNGMVGGDAVIGWYSGGTQTIQCRALNQQDPTGVVLVTPCYATAGEYTTITTRVQI